MTGTPDTILVTGATGLVGRGVVRALLEATDARIAVLVRDIHRWHALAARLSLPAARIVPLRGDLTRPSLGLDDRTLATLRRATRLVIHGAADIVFSRTLAHSRAINAAGTSTVLQVTRTLGDARFVYVSTAFAVGRRTGPIQEDDCASDAGWVNAYEQSKSEAEMLVRSSGLPYVIARPSTIVCDDIDGTISQVNAVHRALRLYHAGLASMMPGEERSPVDVVPAKWVSDAIVALALGPARDTTVHLCAGRGAMPLGELLDRTYALWSRDTTWRRRGIARPALSTLSTYQLFEQSVDLVGDLRLKRITRSLSHFVPQLALPKSFDTSRAAALLPAMAPPVAMYWDRMLDHLVETNWCTAAREAA
jgi:thioester reductase-like protein